MNFSQLIEKLEKEARAIQFDCPKEIKAIYDHQIVESGQGAKGQAFSTMVFIEGDFRSLAYYNVLCLVRLADEPSFSLEQMRILFREYVPLSVTFLKTCGFEKLFELTEDCLAVMEQIEDIESFKEMLNLYSVYIGIYHQWVHNFFPWYLGELFPQRKKEQFEEALSLFNT